MSKAKQIHGIIEALVFLTIFLTCFVLILRESIKHENIAKEGFCSDTHKGGLLGNLIDLKKNQTSDFMDFTSGSSLFLRRIYEHFLRPRGPDNYVFSGTSFATAGKKSDFCHRLFWHFFSFLFFSNFSFFIFFCDFSIFPFFSIFELTTLRLFHNLQFFFHISGFFKCLNHFVQFTIFRLLLKTHQILPIFVASQFYPESNKIRYFQFF